MSLSDCRIFSYYLYVITKYKHDNSLGQDDEENYLTLSYTIFLHLAKIIGSYIKAEAYLEKTINKYAKLKLLTPLGEKDNPDVCFSNSKIPYFFSEDNEINRLLCNFDNPDILIINLFRCFTVTKSNEFLLSLIANFLIAAEPSENPAPLESITVHLKKLLCNTKPVDFVKNAVNLSKEEAQVMLLFYRFSSNNLFNQLLDEFGDVEKDEIFSLILGFSKRDLNLCLRKDSKLRMYGFFEDRHISEDFMECIQAGSMQPYFCDLLKTDDSEKCYNLNSFTVNQESQKIISTMLKSDESVSILLYGKPGSGKTEFAKSLAKKSGLKTYIFKNESEVSGSDSSTNALCRLNCLLSMKSENCMYIIDEAEGLLNSKVFNFFGIPVPSPNKGTVNKMLEESKNKTIWIVNFTNQMDESTLRRFTYSYKFEAMSQKQLQQIAQKKLSPLALDENTNTRILELLDTYRVTGSSVDNVVKAIKSLGYETGKNEELVGCVKSVIKENSLLINGNKRMRENVNPAYDLEVLNASIEPEQIIKMIKNACAYSEENQMTGNAQSGIRMLFYGLSGTGKTEFARYISQQTGRPLLLKRVSDILDKYVGGSEKNIRDAFEEAERTDSILLFDEADSFFASRENAEHSWERTQVNEFLTQMEEFPGILICTTNLRTIMDAAMNRRFHIIGIQSPAGKRNQNLAEPLFFDHVF
ncbi:MAG: AAA family ATPase [Treponema sp.]